MSPNLRNLNQSSPSTPARRQWVCLLLAGSYFCLCCYQLPLALADLLHRNQDPDSVERAIRLDPVHPYAYTLRAEIEDQQGLDSSSSWQVAARLAPRDSESRIRLGLISEGKGELANAERLLLEAASLSQTWFPRWSLANFYTRRMNRPAALTWARAAACRSGGDLRPLFRLIEGHAVLPPEMIHQVLPVNRRVLAEFLYYRSQFEDPQYLELILNSLLDCIPNKPTGWPGLDSNPWPIKFPQRFPPEPVEQSAIFAAIDRLLAARGGEALLRLQKPFAEKISGLLPPFEPTQPLPALSLARPIGASPLDWRFLPTAETQVAVDPTKLEIQIELTGRQSEAYDLGGRVVFLPSGQGWSFDFKSQCPARGASTGLWWELRDLNAAQVPIASIEIPPSVSSLPLLIQVTESAQNRLCYLALCYRRRPGVARQPLAAKIVSPSIVSKQPGHRP